MTARADDWREALDRREKIRRAYLRKTLPGRLARLGVRIHQPPRFGPIPEPGTREFPKV
jgi:hypothetical protein